MSMAIAHFAFGAAMTTLVITFFVPVVWYPRTVILAGGGWAMVPDFHWVSPVANRGLHRIHETSPMTDLFWFHRTLDRLDPTDSKSIAALFIAIFIVATVTAEHRSYRVPERVKAAYDVGLDADSNK